MQDQQHFIKWFTELASKPKEYTEGYIQNLPVKLVKSFLTGLDKHLQTEDEQEDTDAFTNTKELLSNYAQTALKRYHPNTNDYMTHQMIKMYEFQGSDTKELLA